MCDNQKVASPVFQFSTGETTVTVMFSATGVPDVKAKIRDILTESFGERAIEKCRHSTGTVSKCRMQQSGLNNLLWLPGKLRLSFNRMLRGKLYTWYNTFRRMKDLK